METKAVVIKKYENRRLYDTTNSRYVNLDEVAQMLQRGEDVKVLDAATSEDITRIVLTQIIVEDARAANSNFPLDVLRQMVIASGRAGQEGTLKYMKAILDFYQNSYRVMGPSRNPFDFMSRQSGEKRSVAETPGPEPGRTTREARPQSPAVTQSGEVTEMKRRLEELEKIVSSIAPKKNSRKKKPGARRVP